MLTCVSKQIELPLPTAFHVLFVSGIIKATTMLILKFDEYSYR